MKSRELCEYLERLRSARNISQEAFTDGVVSLRQYRRYLNGESDLPFQVLDLLSEKLGIQTINLLREIETERINEAKKVDSLYNSMSNNSTIEFMKLSSELRNREFLDIENERLYKHSLINDQFSRGIISSELAFENNKKLINYPKIFKQTILTLTEMLILSSLVDFSENQAEQIEITDKLKHFIYDESFVLNINYQSAFNILLFRLAKYYGKNEKYEDVIKFCRIGINRNDSLRYYYLNDYFYYFLSLAYYRQNDEENHIKYLVKCFNVLHFEGNQKKIDKFTNLINKDFNIEFKEFVTNIYKAQLEAK
jgi:transcriptional regulator with XRE-family HTH domain